MARRTPLKRDIMSAECTPILLLGGLAEWSMCGGRCFVSALCGVDKVIVGFLPPFGAFHGLSLR